MITPDQQFQKTLEAKKSPFESKERLPLEQVKKMVMEPTISSAELETAIQSTELKIADELDQYNTLRQQMGLSPEVKTVSIEVNQQKLDSMKNQQEIAQVTKDPVPVEHQLEDYEKMNFKNIAGSLLEFETICNERNNARMTRFFDEHDLDDLHKISESYQKLNSKDEALYYTDRLTQTFETGNSRRPPGISETQDSVEEFSKTIVNLSKNLEDFRKNLSDQVDSQDNADLVAKLDSAINSVNQFNFRIRQSL